MEDNLNLRIWKMNSIVQEMEDDLNLSGNGRRPQFFSKWKTTKVFSQWNTTSIQYQLIPNISEVFLLANVDSKFQIKNNLKLNQSQPSLT